MSKLNIEAVNPLGFMASAGISWNRGYVRSVKKLYFIKEVYKIMTNYTDGMD
jgi:hypothetical protein